tara:strand:+ start:345 stop:1082 length:738 start_codon:yes stop_codon:yes gene_type:complete
MKKTFLILFLLSSLCISAQGEFYVGLHYIKVKSEYAKEFIEVEKKYFSKIHKARIDSGDKIAWDMWKLQNNDMNDSETIFVFAHLQDIDKPFRMGNPNKMFSASELKMVRKQRIKMVIGTKFVQTVFKGGFVPADGTPPKIAILNFINAKAGKWYDLENTLINEISPQIRKSNFIKSWGVHKIVSPREDDSDYIIASFYSSMNDYYKRGVNTIKPSKSRIERMNKLNKMRDVVRQEVLELVLSER